MKALTDENMDLLSVKLRTATQSVHSRAEGASFIKKIFDGSCSEQEYYRYLWSLLGLYETLESALAKTQTNKHIAPIFLAELFRLEALKSDMQEWQAYACEIPEGVQQAVHDYQSHLLRITETAPHLLVAHAYGRYLGDLSGGLAIGKVLEKRFKDSKGLNFYSFPLVTSVPMMKALYRGNLDQIGAIDLEKSEAICREAIKAFEFNGGVFSALSEP